MLITPQDALLVVDMQNDFMPGGALAVGQGDEIVPLINQLLLHFSIRVFTRDWHPIRHISFSNQPSFTDKSWPTHCVQNTPGAQFHPGLHQHLASKLVSKGTDPAREAYSGFQDTDLSIWLNRNSIRRVFIAGLATEYCVKATALDALQAGFETVVIRDATRAVNPANAENEFHQFQHAGIRLVGSKEILKP